MQRGQRCKSTFDSLRQVCTEVLSPCSTDAFPNQTFLLGQAIANTATGKNLPQQTQSRIDK